MLIKKNKYLKINEFFAVRQYLSTGTGYRYLLYVNFFFQFNVFFLQELEPESEPVKKIPGASLKGTGSTTLEHSSTRCSAGQMCATILIIAKSLLEEPRALWTLWYEFFSCDRYGTGNNLIQKEEAIPISFKALQQNRKYGKLQYEKIRNGFFFRKSYKSLFFPAKKLQMLLVPVPFPTKKLRNITQVPMFLFYKITNHHFIKENSNY